MCLLPGVSFCVYPFLAGLFPEWIGQKKAELQIICHLEGRRFTFQTKGGSERESSKPTLPIPRCHQAPRLGEREARGQSLRIEPGCKGVGVFKGNQREDELLFEVPTQIENVGQRGRSASPSLVLPRWKPGRKSTHAETALLGIHPFLASAPNVWLPDISSLNMTPPKINSPQNGPNSYYLNQPLQEIQRPRPPELPGCPSLANRQSKPAMEYG